MEKIDFVVTWLDSADPQWQEQYAFYKTGAKGDKNKARYREMNIFNYWFRAVEKYAPWVNKVYLVTNGKFPDWINKDNPKLVLVKHEDYIPKEFLPTFNSCTIELHMHRIKGLSEHFVYFNDDVLINCPVTPDYYFKEGLPCDNNKETCFNVPLYTPRPHLGLKGLIMSSVLMKQHLFVGFSNYHCEQTFLKSTYQEVWDKESDFLNASCTRFREEVIANPYLFRYWQLAKNMFYPLKRKSYAIHISDKSCTNTMDEVLLSDKYHSVCINDTSLCTDEDFEFAMNHVTNLLEKKFPEKSSFEL